jgi:hypothetical protein
MRDLTERDPSLGGYFAKRPFHVRGFAADINLFFFFSRNRIIRVRKERPGGGEPGGTTTSRTEESMASCITRGGRYRRCRERGKYEATQILSTMVAGQ